MPQPKLCVGKGKKRGVLHQELSRTGHRGDAATGRDGLVASASWETSGGKRRKKKKGTKRAESGAGEAGAGMQGWGEPRMLSLRCWPPPKGDVMWGHSHVTPAVFGEVFCRSLAALPPFHHQQPLPPASCSPLAAPALPAAPSPCCPLEPPSTSSSLVGLGG